MAPLRKVRDMDIYSDEAWYCGPGPSAVVYPDGEIVVAFRRSRTAGPRPSRGRGVRRQVDGRRQHLVGARCLRLRVHSQPEPDPAARRHAHRRHAQRRPDHARGLRRPQGEVVRPHTGVPGGRAVHRPRSGHLLPGRARVVRPPLHRQGPHLEPALLRRVGAGLGPRPAGVLGALRAEVTRSGIERRRPSSFRSTAGAWTRTPTATTPADASTPPCSWLRMTAA